MSPASEISLPEADTHTCCLCKVYKLDIFQTNVTSTRWQKWVAEAGHIITNWSDTKLSVFTTTRAVLTELYTQVPSLSRTHTHTPNILYALSQCAAFFVHLLFSWCCFLFLLFFKQQPVHVSDRLQIFPSCIC